MTYKSGLKDGLPIGLGYFSVSFSFGLMAVSNGLSWWQAVLISVANLTSAGQVAGVGIMGAAGACLEMAITTFIINFCVYIKWNNFCNYKRCFVYNYVIR